MLIKKISYLFMCTLSLINSPIYSQDIITKIYCKFLGDKEISFGNKIRVMEALSRLGIEHPEKVSIKQMNKTGSLIAQADLSSFTAFGIWFKETYLNTLTEKEKVFQIYHEAAHYAKKHHQKILASSIAFFIGSTLGINLINSFFNLDYFIKKAAVLGIEAAATFLIYLYLLALVVKEQEKDADILAATTLINSDRKDIVEAHIKRLKEIENYDKDNTWWYSAKKQVIYLESLLLNKN